MWPRTGRLDELKQRTERSRHGFLVALFFRGWDYPSGGIKAMARKHLGDISHRACHISLRIHEVAFCFFRHDREVCRYTCMHLSTWLRNFDSAVERVLLIEIDARVGFERSLVSGEIPLQQPCVKLPARPGRQA